MYEDITVESIKETILANLAAAGWSTGEGSTAELLAVPMAVELWKRYQADRALVPMFYVDETSG
ncbi:MAG: baseplate J protein, partial [Lawsonibacter sp.]